MLTRLVMTPSRFPEETVERHPTAVFLPFPQGSRAGRGTSDSVRDGDGTQSAVSKTIVAEAEKGRGVAYHCDT